MQNHYHKVYRMQCLVYTAQTTGDGGVRGGHGRDGCRHHHQQDFMIFPTVKAAFTDMISRDVAGSGFPTLPYFIKNRDYVAMGPTDGISASCEEGANKVVHTILTRQPGQKPNFSMPRRTDSPIHTPQPDRPMEGRTNGPTDR